MNVYKIDKLNWEKEIKDLTFVINNSFNEKREKDQKIEELQEQTKCLAAMLNVQKEMNLNLSQNITSEKDTEKLSNSRIQVFLLAVELERIRKLYLDLENEYVVMQGEYNKAQTQLQSKALPVISEGDEESDVNKEGIMIKSFL